MTAKKLLDPGLTETELWLLLKTLHALKGAGETVNDPQPHRRQNAPSQPENPEDK